MPSTRIFVGGLSDKVDRQDLGGKLSRYAPVLSIDLKEKTDPEGNVLLRFAYVNIDGAPSQVEKCIQHLNGASWKGSHLRVERAKESFLDRLNRERATKKQEEKTYPGKSNNLAENIQRLNVADTEDSLGHSKGHRVCPEEKTSGINDNKHSKKRKEYNSSEENGLTPRKNKSSHISDENLQTDSYSHSTRKEKKKKKNEVEEEILSSFKQFSSVWADSDNENDEEGSGFRGSHNESCKKQQGGSTVVKPDRLAAHKLHRRTQNTKDKVFHSVDQNEDTDDTVDENYDSSIGSCTDVRKEQETQLEILDSLDDPHKCASKTVVGNDAAGDQVTRDDHTSPKHQQYRVQDAAEKTAVDETMVSKPEANSKYVKVSKDLSFGQSTSGFSFLAQFSKMNKEVAPEVEKEEVVAAPVSVPRSLVTVHQKVKKRPFFISGNDPEIEAAIEWMTQPITEEIIREFEEALPDLRQVIRTRSFRAKKEEADPRMQRRGRGRGRGRGQGRGQGRGRAAGDDTRIPYRDHRWRERDVKK